jgi:hypothetical protein
VLTPRGLRRRRFAAFPRIPVDSLLYSFLHLASVLPPQVDADWFAEAGPGPPDLDRGSSGPETDITNRNTTFMTWNLLHMASTIKDLGGESDRSAEASC